MYTITLNDGTKISGLTFENNLLMSDAELRSDMFRGKLAPVTITSDDDNFNEITGIHPHMEVCYIREIEGKFGLALADIPDERWEFEKLRANQEFIAMMTGIQL